MNELSPVKTYSDLTTLSLNDQTKFRLNEINKIKDYFEFENKEREGVIKRLSKYIAALDYTDKTLILLYATRGAISICKPYFSVFFNHKNNKEAIKKTRKNKKNKIKLLC